ncbi:transposase [Rhizobium leguminosarum]|uniref:Tn3 family transposase n=1 Tax=Rhizobium leguminosarum TaxID=384 RepID=UPI001C943AF4|nr:transposase [Rhizobium leguminosarum]
MAHACPGITRRVAAGRHLALREETFALALAPLVEAQYTAPFSAVFGPQTVLSSDGQHIHLGGAGEKAGGSTSTMATIRLSTIPILPAAMPLST